MRKRPLSIRTILLLTVSALTLLMALLVARQVYLEWERLIKIQSLKEAKMISDKLFDATGKLSVERDIAYTMLHAPDTKTIEEFQPRLEESWSAADNAFNATMEALQHYDFPEIAVLHGKIETRLFGIRELRKQINLAVAQPVERREKALADRWFEQSTALIVQVQDLWMEFLKHFTDIDPIVTQHLRYKHHLRIIMDYSGRERAIIGRLIVENAEPTPQEFAHLLRGQGIIEISWKNSEILANQSGLFAAIAPNYTDAQSHYLTLYGMVRDIFYVAPGTQRKVSYPISVDFWFELSAQAEESLNALKEASFKETQRYVEKLESQAKRAIVMHSLILVLALALCFYSFWVISRRVIRPINAMVEALVQTTRGESVSSVLPATGQKDEIGKLAQVLHAFQQNMEQIRHATLKMTASENRLRAVVDNALNGIITLSERGIIESFNPACERLFGYKALEVIGQNVKMLMPEPYHSEHDGYLSRYVATGEAHIIGTPGREVSARRKDGSVFPIDLSVCAFQIEDGRHFSGIIRDITERKNAEANLLRYTRALERSNQELDDFAYIASHDLKEPLRGLFNHASFLIEDYQDKLDTDGLRRLHRLSHLSQRMEHLVNDLLYFSRLGRAELAVQEIDPNEAVSEIQQMMESFLKERNAHIRVPHPMPRTVCDKPRITEVFRNLITNAVKYNDKPERIVEVGFIEQVETPRGLEKNVFYVKDNGIGIEPDFHQEIFRIFKRLQRPTEEKESGTGAGLTFVKKIVERHAGRIWLESEPGKGTVFYFNLNRGDNV